MRQTGSFVLSEFKIKPEGSAAKLNSKKTVMLALSGGVDSSVCAELLKKDGYEVRAVVMKMSDAHEGTVESAKAAAKALEIPLTVLDLREQFKEKIIDSFICDYKNGRTPNPCVICNPLIKFNYLLKTADEQGCDYIATGHYAQIGFENERYFIKRSESSARDQSYMLYRLSQEVLSRLILPLSAFEKSEVREKARELNLSCAEAPDSQENCFIPDNDYGAYIEKHSGSCPKGDFIAPDGSVCGRHKGIIHYTVGQRKGLGIALGQPVFIKEIDAQENRIYLAFDGGQYRDKITVKDCVFMLKSALSEPTRAQVKIRSAARAENALLTPLSDGRIQVKFDEAVKAPAKGQSAVFYINDAVLGGGFIQ